LFKNGWLVGWLFLFLFFFLLAFFLFNAAGDTNILTVDLTLEEVGAFIMFDQNCIMRFYFILKIRSERRLPTCFGPLMKTAMDTSPNKSLEGSANQYLVFFAGFDHSCSFALCLVGADRH
jgi:hypothetical protein